MTLSLVVPRKGKKEIWTANVGDSRTLLLTDKQTEQLTEDAKPNADRFNRSVKKRGGLVFRGRIFGSLAVARAIGDRDFQGQGLTPRAKVTRRALDTGERATLVLHCDGVNEVFSTAKVAEILQNPHFKKLPAKEKSEYLAKAAYVGQSMDNISVMIAEVVG